ncbi:hypothetical protein [Chryseobacterium sp. BIGb0232]|uniref:hypothetical protein n=1 Tax=Chryseobacterium sp. BIGb0232 TaxID=2940598 RepID=UPI000F469152|nr:hypothetical protein [Chryseobacterium sp. BIGb0232]MCS4302010.1 hypothetical protein [Chryseobacterium sp. BIGb0232]ROS17957.1 hypothetical protein EDF65_2344 [Chryseobacterium nakagawai]
MKKSTRYCLIIIVLLGVGYWGFNSWKHKTSLGKLIIIEATFMQYACGDENDDAKVEKVSDSRYNFLLGKDINPETENNLDPIDFKDYFYDNRTDQYHMTYRLKGRLEQDSRSGCSDSAPRFYVEEIERLDGTHRVVKK